MAVSVERFLLLLLPCVALSAESSNSKSALEDLLFKAGDMESSSNRQDVCSCAVESYELSDLERPLKAYNGHIGTNGSDWSAAKCSPDSDANLREMALANSSLKWPITRGEAVMLCGSKRGNPQLMVDEKQNCKCCPIQCGASSAKIHSWGRPDKADSKYQGMPVDDGFDECEGKGWGASFTLSNDGQRTCGCKCNAESTAVATTNLYDSIQECTKHGHSFDGCNKCTCKAPNTMTTIQDAQQDCIDAPGNNYFHAESCSCYCSSDKLNKINTVRDTCSKGGYDFIGGGTCDCICKGGHYSGIAKGKAQGTCEDQWPSTHKFSPSSTEAGTSGSCACTCVAGRYKGKTVQDAAVQCTADGGLPDESGDPCNCMCMNDANQRDSITIEAAENACKNAKNSMPGVFVSSKCKCLCSQQSPTKYSGKEVSVAANTCENTHSPHFLKVVDHKCNCKCSESSNVDVDTAKSTCTSDLKGTFTHPCLCCPPTSDSPCHADYPYIDNNNQRCMNDATSGPCKSFCETAGGAYDNHFKCKCNIDADSGTNATANGDKVKLQVDLFQKKHECEAKSADFLASKCDCICKGTQDNPQMFEDKKTQCHALKNKYGSPGQFDADSCQCLCSSHKGVFHGSYYEQDGLEKMATVAAADLACEGTLVINQVNGTQAECHCKALPTEPCCNSGTGELLSTFKERCNSTCIIGNVADCNCDSKDYCEINATSISTDTVTEEKDMAICTTSKEGAQYNGMPNWNAMEDCSSKGGTFKQDECDCDVPPAAQTQSEPPKASAPAPSPAPAAVPQGPAHLQIDGKCLEYMRGTNGHFIKAVDCVKDHNAQIWTLTGKRILTVREHGSEGYQRCMKKSQAQGNIYMDKCTENDPETQWKIEEGMIKSMSSESTAYLSECLVHDQSTANTDTGVNTFLRPCTGESAGKKGWEFKDPPGMELTECHVTGTIYSQGGVGHYNGATKDVVPYATAKHGKSFSLEMKVTPTGGSGYRAAAAMRSHTSTWPLAGWSMYANPENKWHFAIGTGTIWEGCSGGTVVNNQETKLVASYNDETRELRLYGDGSLLCSKFASGNLREVKGKKPMYIGAGATEKYGQAQGADAMYYFVGDVKELKVGASTHNCAEVSTLSDSALSLELDTVEQELEDYVEQA